MDPTDATGGGVPRGGDRSGSTPGGYLGAGDAGAPSTRAAQIARRIESEVIAAGWPVQRSLGSEAELQARYRVSRSVLREAVRLVEHHQVARMRRGPGGGLIVTAPDAGPATRAVVSYLARTGITVAEVLEARMLLEPLASGLAAERIDETGIARLRALLADHRAGPLHDEFHLALAELAGNPVLSLFTDVLNRLTVRYAGAGRADPGRRRAAVRRLAEEHAGIVAAVTAGDVAYATTLTRQHVETVAAMLADRPAPARTAPGDSGGIGGDKRAELLAATIQDDILAAGWVTGSVLGAETELLARYGVSRAVLREAIRILDHHTVARMRRGPGGGLVVTEPRPQASIDTVALYLEYRRPSREDLRVVRDAIEINAVAAVVAGAGSGDPAALATALTTPSGPPDARRADAAETNFHTGLADLAGNALLALFLRILVELFRRHWSSSAAQPAIGARAAAEVDRAHARIVEAIADGDEGLARHRSRRHLEALSSWWL